MRFSYAGQPDTEHTQAYLRFLGEQGEVTFINIDHLADADLTRCDLLVIDTGQWNYPVPAGLTRDHLRPATVLVGTFGVEIADVLQLKFGSNYGCMCLKSDAIVWDQRHPVFDGIAGDIQSKKIPDNFEAFREIVEVPDTLLTLRVLHEDITVPSKAGQATAGFGFLDSPDCEIIAGGLNDKTAEHFSIARQGRFLHWGFSGYPDQYTPQGRSLLANCLRYLVGFTDDPVRESQTTASREVLRFLLGLRGWRGIGLPKETQMLMKAIFLKPLFAMPIPPEIEAGRDEGMTWFRANMAYLRNDGQGWYMDTDAQAMGLAINDLALLDACLASPNERSARLWERYTGRSADNLENERIWLAQHRQHLYFTEWGGYRWVSLLEPARPIAPVERTATRQASAIMGAARYGDQVKVDIIADIPAGFYAYTPDSDKGIPLTVTPAMGFELDEIRVYDNTGESGDITHISGRASIRVSLRGTGDELLLSLQLQLCNDLTCLLPQTLELRCPIVPG